MSFCRFSTDNYRCDLYAYESAHGFELHVAAQRVHWDPPQSPLSLEALNLPHEEWLALYARYHDALREAPRSSIIHPDAGGHHLLGSLQQLRDKIEQLISEGLHAPDWLLPELDELILEDAPAARNPGAPHPNPPFEAQTEDTGQENASPADDRRSPHC